MFNILKIILAWFVHVFTALGAFFGVLALFALNQQNYKLALCYMGIAFLIDNVDGTLARLCNVNLFAHHIDGDLLDNIIDFFTYSMIPAVFVLSSPLVPEHYRILSAGLICLASCYQFTQYNAKTEDHFFKGFPSYWNVLILYVLIFSLPADAVFACIVICSIASFIPIKS